MKKFFEFLLVFSIGLGTFTACDGSDYKKALKLMENGSYEEAAEIFTELGDYEDSSEMILECQYQIAEQSFEYKKYEDAVGIYQSLGDYKDSSFKVNDCKKGIANNYFESGDYKSALPIFKEFGDYTSVRECSWRIVVDYFYENKLSSTDSISTFEISTSPQKNALIIKYIAGAGGELSYKINKDNPNLIYVESDSGGELNVVGSANVDLSHYKRGDSLDWEIKSPFYAVYEDIFDVWFYFSNMYLEEELEKVPGIKFEDLGIG